MLNNKGFSTVQVALLIAGLILVGIFSLGWINTQEQEEAETSQHEEDSNHGGLSDLHAIAVDIEDANKLYLASHDGLYVYMNNRLSRTGELYADIMGMDLDPKVPESIYASGHPPEGGNLGLIKSMDGGQSWSKVSDGLDGPVDFHLMAVDRVNTDVIYGVHAKRIQKSVDGGESWDYLEVLDYDIYHLTTGRDENIVYLSTPIGIMHSENGGTSWSSLSEELAGGYVTVVAPSHSDGSELLSYSFNKKLAKSSDGGKTWSTLDTNIEEVVLYMEYAPSDNETIYLTTESLDIYKSTDGGGSWSKLDIET